MFNSSNYNPDILTCLANLSSDEVFTPPQLANEILDLLPAGTLERQERYVSRSRSANRACSCGRSPSGSMMGWRSKFPTDRSG